MQMPPSEKKGWVDAYAHNMNLYYVHLHAYQNGTALAPNMTGEEAICYAKTHGITLPSNYIVR